MSWYGDIYCITNLINGKKYIGLTTRCIYERFKEHSKANSYIGYAIRKYGENNFAIQSIDTASTTQELCDKEIYWIKKYNTFEEGYNLTIGGEGVNLNYELDISLNSKQKRFMRYVSNTNKREVNVNNSFELAKLTLINIVDIYLRANRIHDKKEAAQLIFRLKPRYKKVINELEVIDFKELSLYL